MGQKVGVLAPDEQKAIRWIAFFALTGPVEHHEAFQRYVSSVHLFIALALQLAIHYRYYDTSSRRLKC
jgi:hypothetical protein